MPRFISTLGSILLSVPAMADLPLGENDVFEVFHGPQAPAPFEYDVLDPSHYTTDIDVSEDGTVSVLHTRTADDYFLSVYDRHGRLLLDTDIVEPSSSWGYVGMKRVDGGSVIIFTLSDASHIIFLPDDNSAQLSGAHNQEITNNWGVRRIENSLRICIGNSVGTAAASLVCQNREINTGLSVEFSYTHRTDAAINDFMIFESGAVAIELFYTGTITGVPRRQFLDINGDIVTVPYPHDTNANTIYRNYVVARDFHSRTCQANSVSVFCRYEISTTIFELGAAGEFIELDSYSESYSRRGRFIPHPEVDIDDDYNIIRTADGYIIRYEESDDVRIYNLLSGLPNVENLELPIGHELIPVLGNRLFYITNNHLQDTRLIFYNLDMRSGDVLANDILNRSNDVSDFVFTPENPSFGLTDQSNGFVLFEAPSDIDALYLSLRENELLNFAGSYTANESNQSFGADVTFRYRGRNDNPVADNDEVDIILADQEYELTEFILDGDVDPDNGETDQLVVTAINTAQTLGLVTLRDGVVSYDPNGAFNSLTAGQTANDSFAYTISDPHGATSTAAVQVTITNFNNYQLAVATSGSGNGSVTSTPNGIDCGEACEFDFAETETVILTATPDPGTIFSGWTGYCLGQAGYSCSVPMTEDRQVGAVFNIERLPPRLVSVSRQTPPLEYTAFDSVVWRLQFDEPVRNVSPGDFTLTGTSAGLSVTEVASYIFDITASGGDLAELNSRIDLAFAGEQDITDLQGNALADTAPTVFSYHWFRMDNTRPSPLIVAPAAVNNLDTFFVGVWFDEPVLFYTDLSDIRGYNATTGAPLGALQNYTIAVTPTGAGDILLTVPADVASDMTFTNLNLGSLSALVRYDVLPPSIQSIERLDPQTERTDADVLTWRVTFTEDVVNVDRAEFSVSGSTASVISANVVSPSTYDVTIQGGDLAGLNRAILGLNMIAFHDVFDVAGNRLSRRTPIAANETFTVHNGPETQIAASVAPGVVNAYVGGPAQTLFGAIYASSLATAEACRIALPQGVPAALTYRLLDGSGNPVGDENPVFDIAGGTTTGFAMSLTPTGSTGPQGVDFFPAFRCANAEADTIQGFNSVLLNIGETAPPRIVSFPFSSTFDGVVRIPTSGGLGILSTIAVNIGEGDGTGADRLARITVSVDTGDASLPLSSLRLCETDPSTGACVTPLGTSVTANWQYFYTRSFGVFAYDNGASGIPLDPANARLFVRYADANGVVRAIDSLPITSPSLAADHGANPAELPVAGRYAISVRQDEFDWPNLSHASLFVAPDGVAIISDEAGPRLVDLGQFADNIPVSLQWNAIRFGDEGLSNPGDFGGIRDARSDADFMLLDFNGTFMQSAAGGQVSLSADGSLTGIVAGCLARGQIGAPASEAMGLRFGHVELAGCPDAGLYRAVMDMPANDNETPALLIANANRGWRLAR